jgi:RHS repeat-associated protein
MPRQARLDAHNNAVISTGQRATCGSAYTLDGVGNRTQTALNEPMMPSYNAETVNYTYSLGNILNTAAGNTYTHDANGNRIQKSGSAGTTTYAYDSLNRLTQVASNGRTIQYIYNGLGQRVGKIDNGVQTNYLIDPNGILPQVLAETDASNNLISFYVYDGAGLVAKVTPSNQYYFYHYDGLGSTIAISDSAGQVVNTYCYSPEGLVGVQETIPNPFTYVGRFGVMAEGNGLYYMRARYYDPEVGRFINKDPIGYDGGNNLYAYTGNNLVSSVDPSGKYMFCRQVRSGNSTIIYCNDYSTGDSPTYYLTEPARVNSTEPYEKDQKLAPGLYWLLPKTTPGANLPKGSPVYTTPGQPAGTIITPTGKIRGFPIPAGPHVGTSSKGCPLFIKTKEGEEEKKDFYRRFKANINSGGTSVIIEQPFYIR